MHTIYRRRASGEGMLYAWFAAMHTRVDVALVADIGEERLTSVAEAMQQRVAEMEHAANHFDPHSILAEANREAAQRNVIIGDDLQRMISIAVHCCRATGGLFDPTVQSEHHTADTINDIVLPGDGTIRFRREGVHIDLSGFAKGYALEQLRPMLSAAGIDDALVSIGNSSVMAIGNGSETNGGWHVGIKGKDITVTLRDNCLTVSGNDSASRRHIKNPETGLYVEGERVAAVITNDAAMGEALATALFIGGDRHYAGMGHYEVVAL